MNDMITSQVTPHSYGYDGLGTVQFLTDRAGTVTDQYDDDAFGGMLRQTGSTPNPHQFTGERFNSDLGLYYLRARWYNQATGRFLTRDMWPIEFTPSRELNQYNYVANDPVNAVDPSGLTMVLQQGVTFNKVQIASIAELILVGITTYCAFALTAQTGFGVLLVGPCTRYSGVIQIQGFDITAQTAGAKSDKSGQGYIISSAWNQQRPLTAAEARSRLASLMRMLNQDQKLNRYSKTPNTLSAYVRAVNYTYRCAAQGGCTPPGASFTNAEYLNLRFAPRIDMVILTGRNFI